MAVLYPPEQGRINHSGRR